MAARSCGPRWSCSPPRSAAGPRPPRRRPRIARAPRSDRRRSEVRARRADHRAAEALHVAAGEARLRVFPGVLDLGAVETPAVAAHAALEGPRGCPAVLRVTEALRARLHVGVQHIVATRR